MNKTFLLMLLSIPLFSGCSTVTGLKSYTTAYNEPQPATSSRLRVITDQTVRLVPNSQCIDWHLPDSGIVNSRSLAPLNNHKFNDRNLGIPGGSGVQNSAEVYVSPNTPITLVYAGATRKYQCITGLYFVPEPGADYESRSEPCGIWISKIVKNGTTGAVSREPVTSYTAKACR
ncbi:hypothetical protein ACI77F_06755 [Pseudomonas tritici]|uniref:hypothetical protein n=1 Tax=Pseudomonas tritici TaxID=2745518 RepID=UPI00387B9B84